MATTTVTLVLGYLSFGLVTALVLSAGFLGGLVLWLALPTRGTWPDVRAPYFASLLLFVAHRVDLHAVHSW